MQQVVLTRPGSFALEQTDAPRLPRSPQSVDDTALVRVSRIGVCGTDLHAFAGTQPFVEYPRILGHELGVVVEQAPANDRNIAAGDRCAVEPYLNCGRCIACRRGRTNCCQNLKVLGVHVDGGMRQLITLPVDKLHKSDKLSLDQLALIETLGIGHHAVDRANLAPDDAVLVIGAGPIGLGVIQFVTETGCRPAVMDVNEQRLARCSEWFRLTNLLSPAAGDVTSTLRKACGGDLPTVLFDATGNAQSMMNTIHLASPGAKIVFVGLLAADLTFADADLHRLEITLLASRNSTADTFRRIIRLIEAGRVDTSPWITHRMRLSQVPRDFAQTVKQADLVKAMINADDG